MGTSKCLQFNGNDTSVRVGTLQELGLEDDFTIEMWIRNLGGDEPDGVVLSWGETKLSLRPNYVSFHFLGRNPNNDTTYADRAILYCSDWSWLHITLSHTRDEGWSVFLNGQGAEHYLSALPPSDESPLYLGANNSELESFTGLIADFRIWKFARSSGEIQADMYRRLTGYEAKLACYLPLDGQNGDSASLARDAVISLDANRAPVDQAVVSKPITAGSFSENGFVPLHGSPGSCLATPGRVVAADFDGATSYLSRSPRSAYDSFSFLVVMAWVRPVSLAGPLSRFPVMSMFSDKGGWELRAGGGYASFSLHRGDESFERVAPFRSGEWHHLSVWATGREVRFYVDGRPLAAHTSSIQVEDWPWTELAIGKSVKRSDCFFEGQIRELCVIWSQYRPNSASVLHKHMWEKPNNFNNFQRWDASLDGEVKWPWTAHNVRFIRSSAPLPDSSDEIIAAVDPEKRIETLGERIETLGEQLEAAQTETRTTRQKLRELADSEEADLQTLLEEVDTKIEGLRDELVDIQGLVGPTTGSEPLLGKLNNIRDTLRGLTNLENVDIQSLVSEVATKLNTVQGEVSRAKTKAETLLSIGKSDESIETLLGELETKLDELDEANTNLVAELNGAQTKVETLLGIGTSDESIETLLGELKEKLDELGQEKSSLSGEVTRAKTKVETLLGISKSNESIETLLGELKEKLDDLGREKTKLDGELSGAKTKVQALLQIEPSTEAIGTQLDDLEAKLRGLNDDNSDLTTKLNSAKTKLRDVLQTTVSQTSDLESLLTQIQTKLDTLTKDGQTKDTSIEQMTNRITTLVNDNSATASSLKKANADITALKKTIESLKQEAKQITELEAKITSLEAEQAQTSLEDFVKNANNEITRARVALAQGGGKHALGRVTMEVKMLPGRSGVGMKFPTLDEMKELGASQLSTLNVDFESLDEADNRAAEVIVPTVLGYTEILARRKLAAANLLVDVSYQAVTEVPGRTLEADRVVNQVPKSGDKVPAGSTVTIFIGRRS